MTSRYERLLPENKGGVLTIELSLLERRDAVDGTVHEELVFRAIVGCAATSCFAKINGAAVGHVSSDRRRVDIRMAVSDSLREHPARVYHMRQNRSRKRFDRSGTHVRLVSVG